MSPKNYVLSNFVANHCIMAKLIKGSLLLKIIFVLLCFLVSGNYVLHITSWVKKTFKKLNKVE
jgi:hypothetical protein